MDIQEKIQHIPPLVKDVGDGTVVSANITALVIALDPMLKVGVLMATLVWIYFRVQDLRLASKLKRKELEK